MILQLLFITLRRGLLHVRVGVGVGLRYTKYELRKKLHLFNFITSVLDACTLLQKKYNKFIAWNRNNNNNTLITKKTGRDLFLINIVHFFHSVHFLLIYCYIIPLHYKAAVANQSIRLIKTFIEDDKLFYTIVPFQKSFQMFKTKKTDTRSYIHYTSAPVEMSVRTKFT